MAQGRGRRGEAVGDGEVAEASAMAELQWWGHGGGGARRGGGVVGRGSARVDLARERDEGDLAREREELAKGEAY